MVKMQKPKIQLVKLVNVPIFKQLQLEEALLRLDHRNFCLINTGSDQAIVMGISGNPERLINKEKLQMKQVPVIRRFSGGGTVFVNQDTLFTSFICNSSDLSVDPYPQKIFKWSETIFSPVFSGLEFELIENDYTIRQKKFGGNAQYLSRSRWLHHTSHLFDYLDEEMNYLKIPDKMPDYRSKRSHQDFLCRLKDYFNSKDEIISRLETVLSEKFHISSTSPQELEILLNYPHRRSTTFISLN